MLFRIRPITPALIASAILAPDNPGSNHWKPCSKYPASYREVMTGTCWFLWGFLPILCERRLQNRDEALTASITRKTDGGLPVRYPTVRRSLALRPPLLGLDLMRICGRIALDREPSRFKSGCVARNIALSQITSAHALRTGTVRAPP